MKSLRVRMYRQGFGDCFLLSFPNSRRGESHVLIDCGVLKGSEGGSQRIERVASSIYETTGGRLDALVVTHQHWDHVSGFLQAQAIFDRLQIQEVWLAWTEDAGDPLASELANRKARAMKAVGHAARQLAAMPEPTATCTASQLSNLLGFYADWSAAGQKTTAQAMEWVKGRVGARVRYLKPDSMPLESLNFEDVRIFVLGPPRDPSMLRKSDPSIRASEVYELAGMDGVDLGFVTAISDLEQNAPGGVQPGGQPFDKWFRMTDYEVWDDPFFDKYYGDGDDDQGWRRIESDWLGAAGRLALQLDSHTNNTSLALAFEVLPSERVLLFPGDAQVGNWLSWGRNWQSKVASTKPGITIQDLLARTVLYKVGHHGSHNATLRELGLELMSSSELTAMLPVDRKTARKMDWQMPFPSLYRRLLEKTNGRILDLEFGITDGGSARASEQTWRDFLSRTDVRPDWIDYRIPM